MRCFCCGTRLDTIKSPNVCDACSREIDRFDLAERAEHHRVLAQFAALVEALDLVLVAQMREDHARRGRTSEHFARNALRAFLNRCRNAKNARGGDIDPITEAKVDEFEEAMRVGGMTLFELTACAAHMSDDEVARMVYPKPSSAAATHAGAIEVLHAIGEAVATVARSLIIAHAIDRRGIRGERGAAYYGPEPTWFVYLGDAQEPSLEIHSPDSADGAAEAVAALIEACDRAEGE